MAFFLAASQIFHLCCQAWKKSRLGRVQWKKLNWKLVLIFSDQFILIRFFFHRYIKALELLLWNCIIFFMTSLNAPVQWADFYFLTPRIFGITNSDPLATSRDQQKPKTRVEIFLHSSAIIMRAGQARGKSEFLWIFYGFWLH